jgi:hypothetical protein
MSERMTDAELLTRTLDARRAAHDAPLNPWMQLAAEVDRRGLVQPTPTWDGDSRRAPAKPVGTPTVHARAEP